MGKFLTEAFARKQPKSPWRNLRCFITLSRPRFGCFTLIVKVLPVTLKIAGPGAALNSTRRHLDQFGLILIQPKPQQDQVGTLKVNRRRTA